MNGPHKTLVPRTLDALKPRTDGKRRVVWDGGQANFCVIVTKTAKTFYAVKRIPGAAQPTWVPVGRYPEIKLADARKKAREALGAITEGRNPIAERRANRKKLIDRKDTFANVAEEFIKRHVAGLRRARTVANTIRRELIPVWGDRLITEISRRDVIELIEAILDRGCELEPGKRRKSGGPNAARTTLSAARKLFNWAAGRDIVAIAPTDRIKAAELHGTPVSRDRVLTDDEIRRVWNAAVATPYPYGPLVQLLILTGQRRDEIAALKWAEVDLDKSIIEIPATRVKAKANHVVPLTPTAIEILNGLPRFATGDYVFSGRIGDSPFSGFSKAKRRLDELIGEIEPYVLHDVRRSVRTNLSALGVLPFFAELVIGHQQRGVHAIYDLHRYDREKRAALMRWEKRLLSIVRSKPPEDGNVVPLRARAR
jgi:integrase